MSVGFSRHQLKKLATALDQERVQSREQDGKTFAYVEGWFVIQEANRIFGFDGWDRQMVHFERCFEHRSPDSFACGYLARVAIRVRAGAIEIVREGTGFGHASAARLADAHERALKTAETDATKRALATFGSRFGLMLYDKDEQAKSLRTSAPLARAHPLRPERLGPSTSLDAKTPTQQPSGKSIETRPPSANTATDDNPQIYRLVASDGTATEVRTPQSFCSGLRQLLDLARDPDEVDRLQRSNRCVVDGLRSLPELTNHRGEHYADILERLFEQKRESFALARFADEATFVVKPPPKSGTANDIAAAAFESAVEAARPVEDEEELPRFYGPFMSVPPYPSESLARHLATASKSAATEGSKRANPHARRVGRHPPAIDPNDPPPVRLRRSQITGGFPIDKSALSIPSERRLRSKVHLQFVASKPCVICEQLPCHAHHITFAQPRGLSQKVSDEFTVPLCAQHHNELHAFHNEASWWRNQGVEPLPIANALWCESVKGDSSP